MQLTFWLCNQVKQYSAIFRRIKHQGESIRQKEETIQHDKDKQTEGIDGICGNPLYLPSRVLSQSENCK